MNVKFLYVMAVPIEYGPCLRQKIEPELIGVGPIEAGINLTAILARKENLGEMPDLVISLGSAGSRHLAQAEVYQVTEISYRDMDATPLGFDKGVTPYADYPAKINLPCRIPGIPEATLSTGANIVSGRAYDDIDADMVDMETYAIWRVCDKFKLPLIGLRGISDGKTELNHISGWTAYLDIIDRKLSDAVCLLEKYFLGKI
jgi:adenosylhomocysteine nucleosidase|tara:strand:+ start:25173 stop:25778 length:606 start_codon:yes stop_codon:yes gene_type:complete